jgi:predicted CXXCH cytochrome family protein
MFPRFTTLLFALSFASLPWAARAADLADAPCYECHDELQEEFSVGTPHPPVEEGDCEACHEDHGDEETLMLSDEVPGLCFGCHDEFDQSHLHDPVSEGDCLACHDPHHSENSPLLRSAVPALCTECHDEFEGGGSVHEPVAEGSCTECHDPHQSRQGALLTARYDSKLRVVFSEDAYELCLGCHDLEAFSDPVTEDATEFRYGARNLHYVHLIGEDAGKREYGIQKRRKPRVSCSGCHLPHASEQAKLIRPERDRGQMTVFTISYRQTAAGGGCVVGCHKPLQYVRDAAKGKRPAQLSAPKPPKTLKP